MTKFRPVRGTLSEAMAEATEFKTWEDLIRLVGYVPKSGTSYKVELKPQGYDSRIGWNSHLVVVNGMASGYTDGPVE